MIPDTLIRDLSAFGDKQTVGQIRKQHARETERRRVHRVCADLQGEIAGDSLARMVEVEMGGADADLR